MKLSPYSKFVAAIVGAAAVAVSQGLVVGTAAKWAGVVIAVATAAGVYAAPNKP